MWALTNIASTDFTKMVVDAGAVPNLVTLLSSPSAEIRDQAAWCVGNIAGVCPALRVGALTAGALGPLIQNIMAPATPLLLNNSVWALSNFCRGKAAPELGLISSAICNSSACVVLRNNVDDVKVDALCGLSTTSAIQTNQALLIWHFVSSGTWFLVRMNKGLVVKMLMLLQSSKVRR